MLVVVPGFFINGIPTWLYLAGTVPCRCQMPMAESERGLGMGTRTAHDAHILAVLCSWGSCICLLEKDSFEVLAELV